MQRYIGPAVFVTCCLVLGYNTTRDLAPLTDRSMLRCLKTWAGL